MDDVPRVSILLHDPVYGEAQREIARVWSLVRCHHPWSSGTGTIEAFAFEVLAAAAVLNVPRADIVEHEIAEHMADRVATGNIRTTLADHEAQLHLPIDVVADRRIDRDVVIRPGDAGYRLGEDGRRLDVAVRGGFLGMLLIVAAHRDDVSGRGIDWRQQFQTIGRTRRCTSPRFLRLLKSALTAGGQAPQ